MSNQGNDENWLIFIDTNILLDLYRYSGQGAKKLLNSLEKHKELLIISDQVHMEYLKNRQKVIKNSINEFKMGSISSVPAIITDLQISKMLAKKSKELRDRYDKVVLKMESMIFEPIHNDPVYRFVNRLFKQETDIRLSRHSKIRYKIRHQARKRFGMGYPPRKSTDTSFGDAINWEWIIECAKKSELRHNVLIVSRDGDFGVESGKRTILNDWLKREFQERVSKQRKIEFTNKLTDAVKRLNENVTPEQIEEEKDVVSRGLASLSLAISPASDLLKYVDSHGLISKNMMIKSLKEYSSPIDSLLENINNKNMLYEKIANANSSATLMRRLQELDNPFELDSDEED